MLCSPHTQAEGAATYGLLQRALIMKSKVAHEGPGVAATSAACVQALKEAEALLHKRRKHEEDMEADWKDSQGHVRHLDARLRDIPRAGGALTTILLAQGWAALQPLVHCAEPCRCGCKAPNQQPAQAHQLAIHTAICMRSTAAELEPRMQATCWQILAAERPRSWHAWSRPTAAPSSTCPLGPSAHSCP